MTKKETCGGCPKWRDGWCAVKAAIVPPAAPVCAWRKRFHHYPAQRRAKQTTVEIFNHGIHGIHGKDAVRSVVKQQQGEKKR